MCDNLGGLCICGHYGCEGPTRARSRPWHGLNEGATQLPYLRKVQGPLRPVTVHLVTARGAHDVWERAVALSLASGNSPAS